MNSSKENSKALKSGIWYTLSNFLVKSIGFITTPIFTRLLSKADFGSYNNFISWQSIAVIVVSLNLESTLISAKYDYEEHFDKYLLSILSLSTLSVGIWYIVSIIFKNTFVTILDMDWLYIKAMFVYLLFHSAIVLFQTKERFLYRYKSTVLISMLVAIGTSFLSVLLVLTLKNKLSGRIIGSVLPTAVIGLVIYIIFIYKGKEIDISMWTYTLKICLPYIPHLLSLTLLNSLDRIVITRVCGSEYTALYSLAYNCGTIVTLLMTSMNTAYSPWLADRIHNGEFKEVKNFSTKYIASFCYLALGIMLITPEILLILGGNSYLDAIYVMPPVAMGCVCQFLYTMHVNIEQLKKKTVGMALASISAAILNYVLNILFIPMWGYKAAAYTTLVGFLWLLLLHMLLVKKLQMSHVYDYKFILITVLIMMGLTMCVNILYSNNIARYLVIFLYTVFAVIAGIKNRKILFQIVEKMKRNREM